MIEEILSIGLILAIGGICYVSYLSNKAFKDTMKLLIEASKAKDLYELKGADKPLQEQEELEDKSYDQMEDEAFFGEIKKQLTEEENSDIL